MSAALDDYVPVEFEREAAKFVKFMDDDVSIYRMIRENPSLKPCVEADKFAAYWWLMRYKDFPHALVTLYENKGEVDAKYIASGPEDALETFQKRIAGYYQILKDNGMIAE